jgi:prepilin-type N-terminal cleavage/methylation domain-containing protein
MLQYLGKKEKGFTLMELLIAVAIVVILAGVGIPVYLRFMTNTKLAEAGTNLSGIKLAEETYRLANGGYLSCNEAPRAAGDVDEQAVPWEDRDADTPDDDTFDDIDFAVSGNVRFVYAVAATPDTFTAGALGDTDGDENLVLFIATNTGAPEQVGDVADAGGLFAGSNVGLDD